jgi:hypothetical protein
MAEDLGSSTVLDLMSTLTDSDTSDDAAALATLSTEQQAQINLIVNVTTVLKTRADTESVTLGGFDLTSLLTGTAL